jgi:hypothetical protein
MCTTHVVLKKVIPGHSRSFNEDKRKSQAFDNKQSEAIMPTRTSYQ